ncbi:MraY family glycosyltransferase [Horticoccus sp. 23ND18S-11]|uniref:MraY family glycosyltransferase n=1 Tax=Horticoccus sp. 23ND18S-11 TaxID=3391832 RepID=UPI0039C985E4
MSSGLIMSAAVVAVSAAIAVRLARSVALRRGLLDVPNSRSSHAQPVPRLGGAAFVPVVLLAAAVAGPGGTLPPLVAAVFFAGAALLFALSLIDDFTALTAGVRLAAHAAVAAGVLGAIYASWPAGAGSGWHGLSPPSPGFWLLAIGVVGLLNLYNFMDGIDGLAGVQGVVAGAAWCAIGSAAGSPWSACLGAMLAAGAIGFLTLNWPPAKIFMGDAGSTVLGFSFAALPLLAVVERGSVLRFDAALAAGALVVWPFWADGTFTILRRMKHGENILQAHRSHLYQRLVITGVSHARVTLVYGGLAAVGAALAWFVAGGAANAGVAALGFVVVAFVALWRWTVRRETLLAGVARSARG